MNCLGYYTFSFGKLRIGIRENSSVVEAFTEGNILFRSLQLAPAKPSFNHLTANFADQDFAFVNNSVAVYDIDHASYVGGGAGPMYLKSSVNLSGTSTKSQAARIVSTRLREELGGTSAAEWKAARQIGFKTTVLALNTEPGMVCSMTHAGHARWRRGVPRRLLEAQQGLLHRRARPHDHGLDVRPRGGTEARRRGTDAGAGGDPVRHRACREWSLGTPKLSDYGTFVAGRDGCGSRTTSGNMNIVSRARDRHGAVLRGRTGGRSVGQHRRRHRQGHRSGYGGLHGESGHGARVPGGRLRGVQRRGEESGRWVSPVVRVRADRRARQRGRRGADRQLPVRRGVWAATSRPDFASFGTLRCAAREGHPVLQARQQDVHVQRQEGILPDARTPGAVEAKLPTACVVAAVVGVANNFGYGPFTDVPAGPPQRAFHAGRPDVQRRRVHVPDPRRARGRGHRGRSRCACRTARRSGASMRTSRCRPRTARARTA